MLEHNTFDAQRKMSRPRVADLVRKLRDGRFSFAAIATCETHDGYLILMNGQHQLQAIIEAGISVSGSVHEYVLTRSEGQRELATIFAQYDDAGVRSPAQVAWAYGLAYGLDSMTPVSVGRCSAALSWLKWGGSSSCHSKDEKGLLLKSGKRKCLFVYDVAFNGAGKAGRIINRAPVLTAVMATHDVDAEAAKKFWLGVRDGGLPLSPQQRLRDWLLTHNVGHLRDAPAAMAGGCACYKETYDRCIQTWNIVRTKSDASVRYYRAKPSPVPK